MHVLVYSNKLLIPLFNFNSYAIAFQISYSISFHYKLIIAYLMLYNMIYLPSQHVRCLWKVIYLPTLFSQKKHFFV